MKKINRRKAVRHLAGSLAGYSLLAASPGFLMACAGKSSKKDALAASTEEVVEKELFFDISLAEWSLHKTIFAGDITNFDFPAIAKKEFGISAVEYVNQFFKDKANDQQYLQELKKRAGDEGVKNLLIMIDGEGELGNLNDSERLKAVENHYKWVEAAKFLGCHSIRVNAAGSGTAEEVRTAAVDGLGRLAEFGAKHSINVIVENHGGYSSDGEWLAAVIREVNNPACGTLPDFGNFCVEYGEEGCAREYDRYKGIKQLMPFAKGVSAKSHDFNEKGDEVHTDYHKMLTIVKDAGFTGYIGVEYEGSVLGEKDGIKATKALLERAGRSLS